MTTTTTVTSDGKTNLPYRAASAQSTTANRLGPLADLPGFWEGTGFGIIARPDFDSANTNGFFLQLNMLRETIEFTPIGSPVINRGSEQNDIELYGVTYLHRVTDASTGAALHIETGSWLVVPPTTAPESATTIARLSVIPHGTTVCAVGPAEDIVPSGPIAIPPENTVPFPIGGTPPPPGTPNPYAAYNLSVETPFRTHPLSPGITQALVDDPITMVRDDLAGQNITHITRLITSTADDCVGNIPFIKTNADTTSLTSVFAIEQVAGPDDTDFLQLQYAQTALLNFKEMSFPHVTVGTLVKAF